MDMNGFEACGHHSLNGHFEQLHQLDPRACFGAVIISDHSKWSMILTKASHLRQYGFIRHIRHK